MESTLPIPTNYTDVCKTENLAFLPCRRISFTTIARITQMRVGEGMESALPNPANYTDAYKTETCIPYHIAYFTIDYTDYTDTYNTRIPHLPFAASGGFLLSIASGFGFQQRYAEALAWGCYSIERGA